jgi:hypothetical protein
MFKILFHRQVEEVVVLQVQLGQLDLLDRPQGPAGPIPPVIPIANGGTNSVIGLSNGRIMVSNDGSIVEGSVLSANLSGTNTGDVTLTAVGAAPNANGASLSGQALTLQPADQTNPGIVTALAQTIGGLKTFTSAPRINLANNQLTLGTTNTVTINSVAPAAARTYTIPDTAANSSFVMTDSAQTLNGIKTFSSAPRVNLATNQLTLGTTQTVTINAAAPAAARVYTIPDPGANSQFVMSESAQTINGAKTLTAATVIQNSLAIGTTTTTPGLTLNNITVSYVPTQLS